MSGVERFVRWVAIYLVAYPAGISLSFAVLYAVVFTIACAWTAGVR